MTLAACGAPPPETAEAPATVDAMAANLMPDTVPAPTDSASPSMSDAGDQPAQPPVRVQLVPGLEWGAIYDTAFGIQTDPGWRQEVPGIRIPGLAFPEVGRSKDGLARLRALGGTPVRRMVTAIPRLEEWQWGDSLSITVDLDADRLTYLRWSPKALPWMPTRDRLAGWHLVQPAEEGDLGAALGRLITDPKGPVLLISHGDGRVVVVELTWSLPGRFSA